MIHSGRTPPARCGRENLEPNRQHLGPVHYDLPGATRVRKEDDIVVAFINVFQRAEEDVYGLSHLHRITLLCGDHTSIREPDGVWINTKQALLIECRKLIATTRFRTTDESSGFKKMGR